MSYPVKSIYYDSRVATKPKECINCHCKNIHVEKDYGAYRCICRECWHEWKEQFSERILYQRSRQGSEFE